MPHTIISRKSKRLYYGLGFALPSLLLVLGSVYSVYLSYGHYHRYFGLDFDDCRRIVKYGIAPYSDEIFLMTMLLYLANWLWQTAAFIVLTARYRHLHWKTLVWLFGFPVLMYLLLAGAQEIIMQPRIDPCRDLP